MRRWDSGGWGDRTLQYRIIAGMLKRVKVYRLNMAEKVLLGLVGRDASVGGRGVWVCMRNR